MEFGGFDIIIALGRVVFFVALAFGAYWAFENIIKKGKDRY